MADKFRLEGKGPAGPKWLRMPCQMKGADSDDYCRIPINGQRNGNGATWTLSGSSDAPTLSPSIKCGEFCHFHLEAGRVKPCSDHKGRAPDG